MLKKILITTILFSIFVNPVLAITYSPTEIPISEPEIVNPLRGLYKNGTELVALPTKALNSYGRYAWSDIEKGLDTYDFSVLDKDIDLAIANGQKFGFRIRSMKSKTSGVAYVPTYLANDQYGWYTSTSTFIPDWNNPYFLERVEKLLNAISKHYDDKGYTKNISWVEIGMYGQYGEWALSSIYPSTCDATLPYVGAVDCYASDASLNRIIDAHFKAFPNTRKIMMAKTKASAVVYALSKSPEVGWRVDCLGQQGYFDFPTNGNYTSAWTVMQDRWKTAPVVVEYCTNGVLDSSDPNQDDARAQIEKFHISTIANYNIALTTENTADKFMMNGKLAGYRFNLQSLVLPDNLMPGQSFNIETKWFNKGVAPIYEPWDVYLQFRDSSSNTVVWEAKLGVSLKGILPNTQTPTSFQENLTIPASLNPGNYLLSVVIKDPANIYKPLKLANSGLNPDSSYALGSIKIGSTSASSPAPTPKPWTTLAADYTSWFTHYLQSVSGFINGDFSENGTVDGIDYMLWVSQYSK